MGMHETAKQGRKPGSNGWETLAHSYKAGVFDLLDEDQLSDFNDLINQPSTWVQPQDITIHSMEKKGRIYAVVFYRSMSNTKKPKKEARMTPRELLEDDMVDQADEAKSVDED